MENIEKEMSIKLFEKSKFELQDPQPLKLSMNTRKLRYRAVKSLEMPVGNWNKKQVNRQFHH